MTKALQVVCVAVLVLLWAYPCLPQSTGPGPAETKVESPAEELIRLAESGDADAQFNLGCMYLKGEGVAQDYGEAVKWYRKAAEQGYIRAQFNLGLMYDDGQGVPQDYAGAVEWYRKAAEQGDAAAQNNLALMYDDGKGVPEDHAEAVKWYLKAAEQGSADAQFNLGLRYHKGQGVPQDYGEASKWFRKAAEQGYPKAQFNLGVMYAKGRGVPQDYAEAVKWYRKAAEQGDAGAQNNLGLLYDKGKGVPQDLAEAVKWYRKAADQDFADAQFNLGLMYADGQGVPQDYAEASKWFCRVAEQGNASAQFNLGVMFSNGQGVPQDYVEAYKWFNLAATQGDPDHVAARDRMRLRMTPQQIAEGQRRASAFVPRKTEAPSEGAGRAGIAETPPMGNGTGFFITSDGYLLTSEHVVKGAVRVMVMTTDGLRPAKVVRTDPANDIALLKADGSFKALPLAPSQTARLGDQVLTIGFPNIDIQGFSPKLSKGEISSVAGFQDDPRQFQISIPVQPGNSGGALVDERGNVIGLIAGRLGDVATLALTGALPQNVNYAVKSAYLLGFLEAVPAVRQRMATPYAAKERPREEVVEEVQAASVMVLIY